MSRPIAPLSHHTSGGVVQHPAATSSRHTHPATAYHPFPRELAPGPKNRLILALRSGIPSEVDWALPRLVTASYDVPDQFKLEGWVDSVRAVCYWPKRWISHLEKDAASKGPLLSSTSDAAVEERAINSPLVLRNASFATANNNAKLICQPVYLELLRRLFELPFEYLFDLSLRQPEPIFHMLVTLQSIFGLLSPKPFILQLCSSTLPRLLVETRDTAMISLILPILRDSLALPQMPAPPPSLAPHLLLLAILQPPTMILDLTLDLLITLTQLPHLARQVLALPTFATNVRTLSRLLDHAGRPHQIVWDAPSWSIGQTRKNPASGALAAEQASRRRAIERDMAAKKMELTGGVGVNNPVGESPPVLPPSLRNQLYAMKEPRRSITWMHETFVYSSESQLLQVTFWNSYREFFQHPSTLDPLLAAPEVIKNVTIAFPGASARVWVDGGVQKFVIGGMGFRKNVDDDEDRYSCLWTGCPAPHGIHSSAGLLQHVQSKHLGAPSPTAEAGPSAPEAQTPPSRCAWGACQASGPVTTAHILTHIPLPPNPTRPAAPDLIMSDPRVPEPFLLQHQRQISRRPPPPLGPRARLHSQGLATPQTQSRTPTGVAFLTAMLLRNLARCLRAEIAAALPADHDLTDEQKIAKKKHLQDERFGLPIPEGVLREEEEEEKAGVVDGAEEEDVMTLEERERAQAGFESIKEKVLETISANVSGIGQYLPEVVYW